MMHRLPALPFALLALAGCAHEPAAPPSQQARLESLQPKRIWKLLVRWEPYLLDERKAVVIKEFRLEARGEAQQAKLAAEIDARGGDTRYLRWLEAELFPLGNWEKRESARVSRGQGLTTAVVVTRAFKEVPATGMLEIAPVTFPDPVLRGLRDGCRPLDWDVLRIEDSVATEIVYESRKPDARALLWSPVERDLPVLRWKAWAAREGMRVAYRTVVFLKTNISRCPLPPKVYEEMKLMSAARPQGIEW